MEFNQAIEFAVVSSWEDLVKSNESGSIHVEYENIDGLPLTAIEVWMIKNRGYGTLVGDYLLSRRGVAGSSSGPLPMHFRASYGSTSLAGDLDFIMRNQDRFNRPIGGSIHGLVRIDVPSQKERENAASWSKTISV
jgi:hypothetical protein